MINDIGVILKDKKEEAMFQSMNFMEWVKWIVE